MSRNTYGQAVQQARRALGQARLADPNEHFPYKHAEVSALLETDVGMGPGIPGGVTGDQDTSRTIADYLSQGVADATHDYVEAQAAHLGDPEDQDLADRYAAARDQLIAARLDHRTNRGETFTVGAAARRAG